MTAAVVLQHSLMCETWVINAGSLSLIDLQLSNILRIYLPFCRYCIRDAIIHDGLSPLRITSKRTHDCACNLAASTCRLSNTSSIQLYTATHVCGIIMTSLRETQQGTASSLYEYSQNGTFCLVGTMSMTM